MILTVCPMNGVIKMIVVEKKNYKVYKYKLPSPECTLTIPYPAKLLSCKMLDDQIYVWFLVEQRGEELNFTRKFLCMNTGVNFQIRFTSRTDFVNTVTSSTGIVWHVYMSEGTDNNVLVHGE
jgi:hypothetical protein